MLVYRWFLEKERLLLPFFRLIFESISLKRKKLVAPFHFKQMHRVRILCAPNDICNFIFVSWLMFPITSTFSPSKYMLNLKIYKSTIASNANWCSFSFFLLFFKPKWDFDCINWRLQQIYLMLGKKVITCDSYFWCLISNEIAKSHLSIWKWGNPEREKIIIFHSSRAHFFP